MVPIETESAPGVVADTALADLHGRLSKLYARMRDSEQDASILGFSYPGLVTEAAKALADIPKHQDLVASLNRASVLMETQLNGHHCPAVIADAMAAVADLPAANTDNGVGHEAKKSLATANLMTAVRRALVERRQIVEVGGFKFRFQRAGVTFEDDNGAYQALEQKRCASPDYSGLA